MAALFRRSVPLCRCQRAFSTSSPLSVSLQWDKNKPEALAEMLPAYPYGPARWFKQSGKGLYGGQRIQFGNNVGKKIPVKTRRTWHPNVFTKKLFSKSLNRTVQIRVSARVLRTIDKLGGLDEYLLGIKQARIKELGESGWFLRWAIMQTPSIKKRFREERRALGIIDSDKKAPPVAGRPSDADTVAQEAFEDEDVEEFEDDAEADLECSSHEETELITMADDAFKVEHNADLPRIKFRVGPRKHVVLTAHGWVRTRPDPQHWANLKKAEMRATFPVDYVESRVEKFKDELDKKAMETGLYPIREDEMKKLVKAATWKYRKELDERVDRWYEKRKTRKEGYKAQRVAAKKEARQQERLGSEFPSELEI